MKRILALILSGLMLAGCSDDNTLRVGVGPLDSDYHKYAVELNEKLEKSGSSLRLKPIITADSTASVRLLNNGIIDIAIISASSIEKALVAESKIDPAQTLKGASETEYEILNDKSEIAVYNSTVAGIYDHTIHVIVRADAPYEDISDLSEKTVSVGSYDDCAYAVSFGILKDHGIKRAARKIQLNTPEKAVEIFKNNQAEALFLFDKVPSTYVSDLANSIDIKFLSVDKHRLKSITKFEKSLTSTVINANQYKGQKEAVDGIDVKVLIQAHNGTDSAKIAELMKVMFKLEGKTEAQTKEDVDMTAVRFGTVPNLHLDFHPESVKFYEKIGFKLNAAKHESHLFSVHIVGSQD